LAVVAGSRSRESVEDEVDEYEVQENV
jgi:hypothetical protein